MRLGMGSICSIYVLYLLDMGLSFSQITMVNAAYFALIILFELPTGMLADGRGRGYSIIAGAVFCSLSGLAYFMANGVGGALLAEGLCAVGAAFFSGALLAWIADAPDREGTLKHVYATQTIVQGLGTVAGSLIGVYLAVATDRSMAFLVLAVGYGLAALFAWIFMRGKEPEHSMGEFEALRHAVAHLKSSPSMRWALGAQMATGIFGAYNLLWTPLLIVKFSQVELGWVWMLMHGSIVISGWLVRRAKDDGSERNHLAVRTLRSLLLVALSMGLVWILDNGIVWVTLILVHEVGRGAFAPYLSTYVNERVPTAFRATYGSLQSFLGLLGIVAVEGTLTILFMFVDLGAHMIPWVWAGASLALAIAVVALYRLRPRV